MLPPDIRDYYLDIRCPRCGGHARWEEPFAFLYRKHVTDEELPRLVPWGGWLIREKFPSVVRWTAPRHGYPHYTAGVSRCHACHAVVSHRLQWLEDAYWRWRVRGRTLYAWNEEHARVLLDYIHARLRDPHRYGTRYRKHLQRLPAALLDARVRDRLAGQIAETLRAHGVPLDPPPPRAVSTGPE
jgi:hypothetical protein